MAKRTEPYPRDMIGYGRRPPHPHWPGQARVAVQFVLNFEEGGETSPLHGDQTSEVYLHEVVGLVPRPRRRDEVVESVYEYGTRAGFWRILRLFNERNLHFTTYAVGMALARHKEAARALIESEHEIASHGWRWIDYQKMSIAEERKHMRLAIQAITEACGQRPIGWYTGRVSPNTRRLVVEEGGFLYDSDAYNDDLPYWVTVDGKGHLVIPYTLDNNDMKFSTAQGFNTSEDYLKYLRDAFDTLYREGETAPKMMSIGMHMRLVGRPGRIAGLARFLDHIQRHDNVWICRRVDIARHWISEYPYAKSAAAHG
ncbi:MAG: allantoinase PuuE [Proteobacteria bacterium]|nr:allantoinase PuuE [Pseudomonadota bacterium]